LHRPADLEHLLKHVAARVLEVDQDDVGIDRIDAREQMRRVVEAHHVRIASLAQPIFEDGGANRVLVDDDDLERGMHGAAGPFSSTVPTLAGADLRPESGGWANRRGPPDATMPAFARNSRSAPADYAEPMVWAGR